MQMYICVDRTVNMHCTICKQFTYHSLRTKICRFFVRTQREVDALCVLCSRQINLPHAWRKLFANHLVCMCVPALTCELGMKRVCPLFAHYLQELLFSSGWDNSSYKTSCIAASVCNMVFIVHLFDR